MQIKRRTCGCMEVHNRLLESQADFRNRQQALERATVLRTMALDPATHKPGTVTIPVVVHVVYKTSAENISDVQVASQIDALNRDYSANNPDKSKVPTVWSGMPIDSGISFALDRTIRKQSSMSSFSTDDSVKFDAKGGSDIIQPDKYLNLWACSLGGGLLGYAQFPGGPVVTDGVVILNSAFGTAGTATAPFNLGRTAVHEVGHWLNLRHIWGDTEDCSGTDFVPDTPNAQGPNYGKPAFPHVSCSNGPSGDMFVNYMDYVDDDTMVMFTPGQVSRMWVALQQERKALLGP